MNLQVGMLHHIVNHKNSIASILCVIVFSALVSACGGDAQKSGKPASSGKTLEVLVVADANIYTGATKDLVDSLFRQPQQGLPAPEPLFDVVNIPFRKFFDTKMFKVHRNAIILDVNEKYANKVMVMHDQWAAPQVAYQIQAHDTRSLDSLIALYFPIMRDDIYRYEHKRIIKAFKGDKGYDLCEAVKKQFGFELMFSQEFAMAKPMNPNPDFAWIRKEAKDFGIGVLVQKEKYTNTKIFEQDQILEHLDTLMNNHIPGSVDSSYMGIERRDEFFSRIVKMDGSSYCVETRGRWRAYHDFMGGPFVCYTLLSPDEKEVITLCGYVYCPRFDKRDYLMQVESICNSIRFESIDITNVQ